jgi:hypothetical protein
VAAAVSHKEDEDEDEEEEENICPGHTHKSSSS